jgi:hypothetical protein
MEKRRKSKSKKLNKTLCPSQQKQCIEILVDFYLGFYVDFLMVFVGQLKQHVNFHPVLDNIA